MKTSKMIIVFLIICIILWSNSFALGIKITKKISIKNLKENTSTIIDVPDKVSKETEMHNSLF